MSERIENQSVNQNSTYIIENDDICPPRADFSAPPPYDFTNDNVIQVNGDQHIVNRYNHNHFEMRPTETLTSSMDNNVEMTPSLEILLRDQQELEHHGELPTYEEVEMQKSLYGELSPDFLRTHISTSLPSSPNPLLANVNGTGNSIGTTSPIVDTPAAGLTFITIDASESEDMSNDRNNSLLGTDIMFIAAFMVAFLFNWIGFLMLTCFCNTIAARYGALSGFGLSLTKWTLIVKHSTKLASYDNSWVWWIIMVFGLLICVRALLQYVSIKRTWHLLSSRARERLLFIY